MQMGVRANHSARPDDNRALDDRERANANVLRQLTLRAR